jgi:hypothetical protein
MHPKIAVNTSSAALFVSLLAQFAILGAMLSPYLRRQATAFAVNARANLGFEAQHTEPPQPSSSQPPSETHFRLKFTCHPEGKNPLPKPAKTARLFPQKGACLAQGEKPPSFSPSLRQFFPSFGRQKLRLADPLEGGWVALQFGP